MKSKPSKLPPVDPPTREVEQRILDAALTEFAKEGYQAATMRNIANSVKMNVPLLYHYCKSKEHLFTRLLHWKHAEVTQELQTLVETTVGCANRLKAILRATFARCRKDPRIPRLMLLTHFDPDVESIAKFYRTVTRLRFEVIEGVMQAGLEAGELRGGNAQSLALIFCALMDQHTNLLIQQSKPKRSLTEQLADELVNVFLHGVGTKRRVCPELPKFPVRR